MSEADQSGQIVSSESQDGVESGTPIPSDSEQTGFLQIPPIPELRYIESQNVHIYDPEVTVRNKAEEAEGTPAEERTPEQVQLIKDLRYIDMYCFDGDFKDVFTPEELHGLVEKFKVLEAKNRPDFNGIESRIVDFLVAEIADARRTGRTDSEFDSIVGIVDRAQKDEENRKGMNWKTL